MSQLLLVVHILLVTSTPALVVWIVSASAFGGTGSETPRPGPAWRRLQVATLVSWGAFAVWAGRDGRAFSGPDPQAPLGLVELAAFTVLALAFGLPALGETAAAAKDLARVRARSEAGAREATLRPRRVTDYLPSPWPVVPLAFALLAAIVVGASLWGSSDYRQRFLAGGFALAGVAFAALYSLWIREVAGGPEASSLPAAERDRERRDTVRRIFRAEVCLVATFAVLALVLAATDWAIGFGPVLTMAAAVVGGSAGVVGCAYALASGVAVRTLEAEVREVLR